MASNEAIIDRVFESVIETGLRRIGLFGLSFKQGTDDLRESALVTLAERFLGRGLEVLIWDDQVHLSSVQGANRAFIDSRIPHLSKLLTTSPGAVAQHAEIAVIGTDRAEVNRAIVAADVEAIVDLVRVTDPEVTGRKGYRGVAW